VADWVRQGRWLGAIARASGWWIGDWIRYGNARYGDRYGAAARVTGYDVQSLRNMAYVAGRFNPQRRRDRLSFSHHAELAGLSVEEQELWLDRTVAGALSVSKLRSELRQARQRAASRAALAEARRKAGATAQRVPPNAHVGREVLPAASAQRTTDPPSAPIGFEPIGAEVVCPACGHHFDAASGSPAEAPDRPRPSSRPGGVRLALAPPREGCLPRT
jgi:hypothetical protein